MDQINVSPAIASKFLSAGRLQHLEIVLGLTIDEEWGSQDSLAAGFSCGEFDNVLDL